MSNAASPGMMVEVAGHRADVARAGRSRDPTFAADPDEPFDVWVLPRTPGGDHDVFVPMCRTRSQKGAVDTVSVPQDSAVPRPWGCVH